MTTESSDMSPWAPTYEDREHVLVPAKALVGKSLASAHYLYPASRQIDTPSSGGLVDQTDIGVTLVFEDGSECSIRWFMANLNEGLGIEWGARSKLHMARPIRVDASSAWSLRLGTPISKVAARWQIANEDADASIWSLKFEFVDAEPVTVALGTLDEFQEPQYLPDELLVFFDDDAAARYRIPASEDDEIDSR